MYTSTTQRRNAGPEPLPRSSVSQSPAPSSFRTGVFGLRVRVAIDTTQQYLFGGDGPSILTCLAEELCIQMARIVVCDFRIHSRLNRTVPAVLRNVRLSFWSCARRAALDTSAALAAGAKRRVVQSDLAIQAANLALRIAELCEKAAQSGRCEKQLAESYDQARRSELAASHRGRRELEARRRAEAEEAL